MSATQSFVGLGLERDVRTVTKSLLKAALNPDREIAAICYMLSVSDVDFSEITNRALHKKIRNLAIDLQSARAGAMRADADDCAGLRPLQEDEEKRAKLQQIADGARILIEELIQGPVDMTEVYDLWQAQSGARTFTARPRWCSVQGNQPKGYSTYRGVAPDQQAAIRWVQAAR